jgi:hypothetical protein
MDVDDDDFSGSEPRLTCPGETITSSQAFMRGHGTYVDKEDVIASVVGTVERVNKLVTVRAIRTRGGRSCRWAHNRGSTSEMESRCQFASGCRLNALVSEFTRRGTTSEIRER